MFLNFTFPDLSVRHAACLCATLDRVISGTSTVYRVKPCFIRCLFCLEICGGSAVGFHIQLKQDREEQSENTGHQCCCFYFILLSVSPPSGLFPIRSTCSHFFFILTGIKSKSTRSSHSVIYSVLSADVLNVNRGCGNVVSVDVRWCSEGSTTCVQISGYKGWWACFFLRGCVHPCELRSPPRALLLTPGSNLSQL